MGKSSMMTKTNLLSVEPLSAKVMKLMKHYFAKAPHSDWVGIFSGLVTTLSFPRALIYCDNDKIDDYFQEMHKKGIAVSANLPGASSEARHKALQDFSSNKTQFLLTHSEPAVCQIMLPKVSCVFHFGLPVRLPSVYGVRLLPLDLDGGREASSILFFEPTKAERSCAVKGSMGFGSTHAPPVISNLSKLFEISFLD